eukprot:1144562-Pelagomonas_calceolata.AAC.3
MASAYRIGQFVRKHALSDRPHVMLWLEKHIESQPACVQAGVRQNASRKARDFQGTLISMQNFTDDLRHRLRGVWRDIEGVDPQETNNEMATYQALFALPFDHNVHKPIWLPRHLHLDLPQHFMHNVSQLKKD